MLGNFLMFLVACLIIFGNEEWKFEYTVNDRNSAKELSYVILYSGCSESKLNRITSLDGGKVK